LYEGEMGDLELRYAHLSNWDSPARKANREALQKRIEEIQAEQVEKNAALRTRVPTNVPPLRIADRYAARRKRDG
jgi:hypothetical protein